MESKPVKITNNAFVKISSVGALQARADKILAQRGLCSKKTYSRSKRALLEKNLLSLKEGFARKKLILAQRGLCSKKTYSREGFVFHLNGIGLKYSGIRTKLGEA